MSPELLENDALRKGLQAALTAIDKVSKVSNSMHAEHLKAELSPPLLYPLARRRKAD